MFAKTFCKPGAFLSIVPLGLRATLQYNKDGCIEKVFGRYDDDMEDITSEVMDSIKSNHLVPITIPLKGGTTWIKGVFYTRSHMLSMGVLPMCIEGDLVVDMKKDGSTYSFYAGNVESYASAFNSAMVIRNWLKMSKFNLLPSYIIPAGLTDESFIHMVDKPEYPFEFPLISGYMIYEGADFRYQPLNLTQLVVDNVTRFNDENGYIKGIVHSEYKDITLHYSDIVWNNIQDKTLVVQEADGKVIYTTNTDSKQRIPLNNDVTCLVCGKRFTSPITGPICCDDEHCRSKLFPIIQHFLQILQLPEMSFEKVTQLIKDDEILCLTDILLLPEYKDLHISVTLDKLLNAVVPVDICADTSVFTLLLNRCSNSIKTFRYYLDNPSKIQTDLEMNSVFVIKLIKWLEDGYNVTTVTTLLDSSIFDIVGTDKRFDGPPIFRGNTFAVTGKFRHGDMNEIFSILQSYSATVVTKYTDKISCLIVGDLKENIDGKIVKDCKCANVPIMTESEFFDKYSIDEDLETNLL